MKGGFFGRFLTFILGLVVGIVLVGGTLAGVVYYAVSAVTVNDVEKYADTEFTFIDKDAEVRDKSILDIFDMVKGGAVTDMTVADAKRIFGIDVVDILEKSIEITVDAENREKLNALKVFDIFKGDNLKTVFNCLTLGDVLKKAGINTSDGLGATPLLQEQIDKPVIDALNTVLKTVDLNVLTIAEIEYLLGVEVGGEGVLNAIDGYKIGELNGAINSVRLEQVLPDFDRDFYIKVSETKYKREEKTALTYKSLIDEGYFVAASDGDEKYSLDEKTGVIVKDDNGEYAVNPLKALPDFRERYSKEDGVYESDRNGAYYIDAAGVYSSDRCDADGTKNVFGAYYYPYSESVAGTYYRLYAAVKTKNSDDKYDVSLQDRKFVSESEAGYFEDSFKRFALVENGGVHELVENATGDYALVHVGKSEPVLKALADETLDTLDGAIGEMRLNEVITIADDSSVILKKLSNVKINELAVRAENIVKEIKLNEVIEIRTRNLLVAASDGAYVALPAGKTYYGTYNVGYTESNPDENIYFIKYKAGATGQRYNISVNASAGSIAAMSDMTIGEMADNSQEVMENTALQDVIEIDGDVYVKTADTVLDPLKEYYYFDESSGIFLGYDASLGAKDDYYEKIYVGSSNAVLKKLATATVSQIANGETMNKAVNDCKLGEVTSITDNTSLMWQIKDTKVSEIEDTITDIISDATVRQINEWGKLGLTEEQLNKTVTGTSFTVGEMKFKDFMTIAVTFATK